MSKTSLVGEEKSQNYLLVIQYKQASGAKILPRKMSAS